MDGVLVACIAPPSGLLLDLPEFVCRLRCALVGLFTFNAQRVHLFPFLRCCCCLGCRKICIFFSSRLAKFCHDFISFSFLDQQLFQTCGTKTRGQA